MYASILVGVDPTHDEESQAALQSALRLLADNGRLTLITVLPDQTGISFFPALSEGDPDTQLDQAQHALALLIRRLVPAGIDVRPIAAAGAPAPAIVDSAHELGSDLIVLTSHDHRWPLRRDTIQQIIQSANCPVLVLPGPEEA
ncbi:MAG: universal stress protein [Alcanivorax sp.]|nr:universal stress protein [Alcanivorax sp.]